MRRALTLGPICVTTCANPGSPLLDPARTHVDTWGTGTHGALAVRVPHVYQALVIALRHTTPAWADRAARPFGPQRHTPAHDHPSRPAAHTAAPSGPRTADGHTAPQTIPSGSPHLSPAQGRSLPDERP